MLINRRGLLIGLASALAAPAIVHAENMMPVRRILITNPSNIFRVISISYTYPGEAHVELVEDHHPSWDGSPVLQRGSFDCLTTVAYGFREGDLISVTF